MRAIQATAAQRDAFQRDLARSAAASRDEAERMAALASAQEASVAMHCNTPPRRGTLTAVYYYRRFRVCFVLQLLRRWQERQPYVARRYESYLLFVSLIRRLRACLISAQALAHADGRGGMRADECAVCMDARRTDACLPCGHKCVCEECGRRLVGAPCPVCRRPVSGMV
jgi:hypothetical protein